MSNRPSNGAPRSGAVNVWDTIDRAFIGGVDEIVASAMEASEHPGDVERALGLLRDAVERTARALSSATREGRALDGDERAELAAVGSRAAHHGVDDSFLRLLVRSVVRLGSEAILRAHADARDALASSSAAESQYAEALMHLVEAGEQASNAIADGWAQYRQAHLSPTERAGAALLDALVEQRCEADEFKRTAASLGASGRLWGMLIVVPITQGQGAGTLKKFGTGLRTAARTVQGVARLRPSAHMPVLVASDSREEYEEHVARVTELAWANRLAVVSLGPDEDPLTLGPLYRLVAPHLGTARVAVRPVHAVTVVELMTFAMLRMIPAETRQEFFSLALGSVMRTRRNRALLFQAWDAVYVAGYPSSAPELAGLDRRTVFRKLLDICKLTTLSYKAANERMALDLAFAFRRVAMLDNDDWDEETWGPVTTALGALR